MRRELAARDPTASCRPLPSACRPTTFETSPPTYKGFAKNARIGFIVLPGPDARTGRLRQTAIVGRRPPICRDPDNGVGAPGGHAGSDCHGDATPGRRTCPSTE